MTEEELLDQIRRSIATHTAAAQRPKTAARCRRCWAENEGSLEKCRHCGHLLARSKPGAIIRCPQAGATDGPATFVVRVAGERRARLGPGGRLLVGRGDDADVWLEASTVSRHHCEVVWDKAAKFPRFRDLGSANGTRHQGYLR